MSKMIGNHCSIIVKHNFNNTNTLKYKAVLYLRLVKISVLEDEGTVR
jgi:hypothetical protein